MGVTLSSKDPMQAQTLELQRQVQELSRQLRQIPSRFPVAAVATVSRVVRVRFKIYSQVDLSVGELLTDAAATDAQTLVWIDGATGLSDLPPLAFGEDALYWAERVGTETRTDGATTTRDLYRLVRYFFAPGNVGIGEPACQLEYQTAGSSCKVLDMAGTALQATLAGAAADHRVPIRGTASNGFRYDWFNRNHRGVIAIPDGGLFYNDGFLDRASGALRGGAKHGDVATVANGLSIDAGEAFRIDLWTSDVDTNFSTFTKTVTQSFAFHGVNQGASVQMVYNGNGAQHQFHSATSTERKCYALTAAGGVFSSIVTVSDKDALNKTVTFSFGFTNGRIVSVGAALSAGAINCEFLVSGGRFTA